MNRRGGASSTREALLAAVAMGTQAPSLSNLYTPRSPNRQRHPATWSSMT
jgi:hypothetical protein